MIGIAQVTSPFAEIGFARQVTKNMENTLIQK